MIRTLALGAAVALAALTAGLAAGGAADAAPPDGNPGVAAFDDTEKQRRYMALLRELRCLVCQNESLAGSPAALAGDLRQVVYEQVAAGRTNAEITRFMVARYGDFVRYRPPVQPRTYLLWYGPPALLLIGLTAVAVAALRSRRVPGPALSAEERRRAAALLEGQSGRRSR